MRTGRPKQPFATKVCRDGRFTHAAYSGPARNPPETELKNKPILAALLVLSMAALIPGKVAPVYGASKAACEMMALGVRSELAADSVGVTLVYPGFVATRMSEGFEYPKTSANAVAERALEGWCRNECRVFPDAYAQIARQHLISDPGLLLDDPEVFRSGVFGEFLGTETPL